MMERLAVEEPLQTNLLQVEARKAFSSVQCYCANFLQHVADSVQRYKSGSLKNPDKQTLQARIQSALSDISNRAKYAIEDGLQCVARGAGSSSAKNPPWARISDQGAKFEPTRRSDIAISEEEMEKRLGGMPVYTIFNSSNEFVCISSIGAGQGLSFFCFKEEDAEEFLKEMKSVNSLMRHGSRVIPAALHKVIHIQGLSYRLIPEASQIKNAIQVKQRNGTDEEHFRGVPVFQSESMQMKEKEKSYRPLFFRKEDLEKYLVQASLIQGRMNPALRHGDIKVWAFEEIVREMMDSSTSTWNDAIFVPPGFNVPLDASQQNQKSSEKTGTGFLLR